MSPYLMANNFTLDLSDLIEEIKQVNADKEVVKRYERMETQDLLIIISNKPLEVLLWKHNKGMKKRSSLNLNNNKSSMRLNSVTQNEASDDDNKSQEHD